MYRHRIGTLVQFVGADGLERSLKLALGLCKEIVCCQPPPATGPSNHCRRHLNVIRQNISGSTKGIDYATQRDNLPRGEANVPNVVSHGLKPDVAFKCY
jgi:hypothetical protein